MKINSGLLVPVFCFFSLTVFSQSGAAVHGRVITDSLPLDLATVILYSGNDTTKSLHTTISDSTGSFQFSQLQPGSYLLKLQRIEYREKTLRFTINDQVGLVQLPPISLSLIGAGSLQAVTVTAKRNIIQRTTQGFIVNAASMLTQAGGTATDLLRSTPTVSVDPDGGITIRGKSPLILLNGRNSSAVSTDQIPASSIESIEIITNPSARYDADAEGGIINIKLKKSTLKGSNGAVALGLGAGVKPRMNSSVLLNHKTECWNIALAYDNRFAARNRNIEAGRQDYTSVENYYLSQSRHDNRKEQLQNLRFNADYSPSAKTTLAVEAIGGSEGQDNDETLTSTISSKESVFKSKTRRQSLELERQKLAELALNLKQKLGERGADLVVNVSTSLNLDKENTAISSQPLNETGNNSGTAFLQQTRNYENGRVSNLQADYTQPMKANSFLMAGYKGILRNFKSDFVSANEMNGAYIPDPATSNIFHFKEQVHAAYLQYNGLTGSSANPVWKYDIGLRAEQVWNNGNLEINTVNFKNNYFNLFPTFNLARYLQPGAFWKLSYSRRINRPGLGQLNPFTDITDSLNQHSGNPFLKPELVHALELGYNRDWAAVSLSAAAFYRYGKDVIRGLTVLKPNGVALTLPYNFGTAVTYGMDNVLSVRPFTGYDANLSVSFFEQHINGELADKTIANNVFSWYGKLINNLVLWKGGRLQVTGVYNSPIATPQGRRIEIYNVDMGFQQKLGKGNGRIGLVVTDIFNTQRNGFNLYAEQFSWYRRAKADTRAVLVTFAYTFGTSFKEKLMENKFSEE
jgi:outer membrane receptor protein involved in Fe transport